MAAPPVKAQYGTPEGVAQAALRADSAHDWRLLLALAHPDALFDYRHSQVMTFKEDGLGFPGVDSCEVKELQGYHHFLLDSVFRVPTPDSLSRLAPDTVFARQQRFLARRRPLRQVVDSFAPARRVVGDVIADDSTAYVVIEDTYAARPFPDWPKRRAQIMTLRRYRGTWRTMLDPDLGGPMSAFAMIGGCQ